MMITETFFGFKEIVFNFFYSFLEIDLYQFDIYFVLHTLGVFIDNLVMKVTVMGYDFFWYASV